MGQLLIFVVEVFAVLVALPVVVLLVVVKAEGDDGAGCGTDGTARTGAAADV